MTLRILLTFALAASTAACRAGSGFYNLPTTLPQCFGAGWGPGYHAPMVLKPCYRTWGAGKGIVRAQPYEYPPIYQKYSAYDGQSVIQEPTYAHSRAAGVHPNAQPRVAPHATFGPPPINLQRSLSPPGAKPERREPRSPSDALRPEGLPLP